jgi:hypothetical protein
MICCVLWHLVLLAQVPTRRGRPSTMAIPQFQNATYPSIKVSPWVISKPNDVQLLSLLSTPMLGSVAADAEAKNLMKEAAKAAACAAPTPRSSSSMQPPASIIKTPKKNVMARGNGGIVCSAPSPIKAKECSESRWLEDAANILDKYLDHSDDAASLTDYDALRYRVVHWQTALEFCMAGQARVCLAFSAVSGTEYDYL